MGWRLSSKKTRQKIPLCGDIPPFRGPNGIFEWLYLADADYFRPGKLDREDLNRMFRIVAIFEAIDLVLETNFLALEFRETE